MVNNLFTANQIVAHLIGDYLLQTHWQAVNKTHNDEAAVRHAVSYCLPFMFLVDPSLLALFFLLVTHYFIDRFRLARYVVWFKNGMHGKVTTTGYPEDTPIWLATWLLIIADNTLHLICNGVILRLF